MCTKLSYPFVCWWASRFLPCPGYYEQCCDKHWGIRVSFRSGFLIVYAQEWDCWVIWLFFSFLSSWAAFLSFFLPSFPLSLVSPFLSFLLFFAASHVTFYSSSTFTIISSCLCQRDVLEWKGSRRSERRASAIFSFSKQFGIHEERLVLKNQQNASEKTLISLPGTVFPLQPGGFPALSTSVKHSSALCWSSGKDTLPPVSHERNHLYLMHTEYIMLGPGPVV